MADIDRRFSDTQRVSLLRTQWPEIQRIFEACEDYAIGSVNEDGTPHITPVGSIFLNDDCSGFYVEQHTRRLPRNLASQSRICVLATVRKPQFWVGRLAGGALPEVPGVRLYGWAGVKRRLLPEEAELWRKRARSLRWSQSYPQLWEGAENARELWFDGHEPVRFGSPPDAAPAAAKPSKP